jgi:AcrR family transcriptional regulator
LFTATLKLLRARGIEAVTFAAVAESASVNRSTLYRRWSTPTTLVLEAIAARIKAQVLVADTGSLRGDMRETLISLARFLETPIGRAGVIASASLAGKPEAASALRAIWAERFGLLKQIFERARSRRELPSDFDVEAFVASLSGALLFRLLVAAEALDESWIDRTLDIALRRHK